MDEIRQLVEKVFGVNIGNTSRKAEYVEARACYYVLCDKLTPLTRTAIADSLNKNHATILHALKEWEYMCKANPDLIVKYKKIHYKYTYDQAAGKNLTPEDLLYMYNSTLLDNVNLRKQLKEKQDIIDQLVKQIK